jgi:hypothetical protein
MKTESAQGVEIGRWYDPDTDCWFVIYKFSSKEFDNYQQAELNNLQEIK